MRFPRNPDNRVSRIIDTMKKILLAVLSMISISAFATQSAPAPAVTGTMLVESGKTHIISAASSGGGGEDLRKAPWGEMRRPWVAQ
jgi:hypothetical protein